MQAATDLETRETAGELAAGQPGRRAVPRFVVDEEARLLLVNHGSTLPCHLLDLSLSGCRVRTQERFLAGILVRVEVTFKVCGLAFRFCGVTQWTDSRNLAGIRFVDVPERRRVELAEALAEVKEAHDAKAAMQAAGKPAVEEALPQTELLAAAQAPLPTPGTALKIAEPSLPLPRTLAAAPPAKPPQPAAVQKTEAPPPASPSPLPTKRERRSQYREEVDTSAVIQLINIAAVVHGRILDLSLNGCRIHTGERFPVGIYTRVETEFRLEGLPFRLGGVIQAIHDKERRHVGIRFLDMSSRKKEQVEQLMEEIKEQREQGTENRE